MLKDKLVFLTDHVKKYILLGVMFRELELIARIISVFQIGDVLYAAIRGNLTEELLYRTIAVCVICLIVQAAAVRFSARMQARSSTDIKRTLREKIYEKLMNLGVSYREKISQTEVIYLSTEGVSKIESFYEKFLPQLVHGIAAPITLSVLLAAAVNVRAALVPLVFIPFLPGAGILIIWAAGSLRENYHDSYSELTRRFMENLRGLTTLKLYRADDTKAEEMDREAENYRTSSMRMLAIELAEDGVVEFLALAGSLSSILVGVSEYIYGTFSLTGCIMLIILAGEYFIPIRDMCGMLREAGDAFLTSDRLYKFLEMREPLAGTREMNVPRLYSETEEVVLANMDLYERPRFLKKSAISFNLSDVHFSYNQGREVLHGVDMVLPSASLISLVGPSGCGKSTVAGILCGKLKNYKGEIRVACEGRSMNLYDIREAELLSHTVLVPTAGHLFQGTVEENLRIAKKDADEQELLDALDAVNLLPYIRAREGLKTMIEAGGANLSVGEAQRFAIARALLKDAEVLIFDEATSNIDADSETFIMQVIRELARRKTVLLISHRLANVTESDCIYVMDNGLIRESGTHEELLAKKGIYDQLYRTQKSLEDYAVGNTRYGKKERQVLSLSGAVHADTAGDTDYRLIHQSLMDFAEKASRDGEKDEPDRDHTKKSIPVLLAELTGLVTPGFYLVLLSVFFGLIGNLCMVSIPVIAGRAVLTELSKLRNSELMSSPVARYFQFMAALALLAVIFSALEKYVCHFAAHGILTQLRHEVYASLRRLVPARFEKKDKTDLVRVLTEDIENLENLYARAAGPMLSALLTAGLLTAYMAGRHAFAGILTLTGFLLTGIMLPLLRLHFMAKEAEALRKHTGILGSFLKDQLDGIEETQQFGNGPAGKQNLTALSVTESEARETFIDQGGIWDMLSKSVIFLCSFGMFFLTLFLHMRGDLQTGDVVTCTLLETFSFQCLRKTGSVAANISAALAGGERILGILEERPAVLDVSEAEGKLGWDGYKRFHGAEMSRVTFAYDKDIILQDFTILLWPKQLIGIHGPDGSGKSTILKLLLRFFDVSEGSISICGEDIRHIATRRLRDAESYMAQDTVIFHDTIAGNIAVGKPGASRVEIIRAARKAALHDFILTLPRGYDTLIDDYDHRLSDGERKRIGIARAFLHNAPLILLDDPTANLDALNEGTILKSLVDECQEKTIVITSSRESAIRACNTVFEMHA